MTNIDIDLIIKNAFNDSPIIQNDGSVILPSSGPQEQAERLIVGIKECIISPLSNPKAGILANHLISVLRISNEWEGSYKIIDKAKNKYKVYKDSDDNDLLLSISDFYSAHATILEKLDDIDGSIKSFRSALYFSELVNPNSLGTITSMNNLANAIDTSGKSAEAKKIYINCIEKLQINEQEISEIGSIVHNNLAYIFKSEGDFISARKHYSKALKFLLNHGDDDYLKIVTLFNAGRNEIELLDKNSAKEYFYMAKLIAENILSQDHDLFKAINSELADL